MKNTIITIILLLFFCQLASSQDDKHDMLKKKIKAEKIAYLTSEIDLTPKEAEKFWPIYNQYESERMKINIDLRRNILKQKIDNEASAKKAVLDYSATHKKEAELTENYIQQFLQVLPAKKVLALLKAEVSFKHRMIKRFKKGHYAKKKKYRK